MNLHKISIYFKQNNKESLVDRLFTFSKDVFLSGCIESIVIPATNKKSVTVKFGYTIYNLSWDACLELIDKIESTNDLGYIIK